MEKKISVTCECEGSELRKAPGPITTAEIVAGVIAAKGLPDRLAAVLAAKALAYLRTKLAAASVVKTGVTQGACWVVCTENLNSDVVSSSSVRAALRLLPRL